MDAEHDTREDAEFALARCLYEEMMRLDPPVDPAKPALDWSDLRDREREFYRLSVDALLNQRDLICSALPLANDDSIFGRADETK
jgi:hypothetical protein